MPDGKQLFRNDTDNAEPLPPHPDEVLKVLCLAPLNLCVTEAARALGVGRKALTGIVNGRAGISPETAVRLSIAFHNSAEGWLNQQLQYDLWRVPNCVPPRRCKLLNPAEHDDPLDNAHPRVGDLYGQSLPDPSWCGGQSLKTTRHYSAH